jgi:hypothetical protein
VIAEIELDAPRGTMISPSIDVAAATAQRLPVTVVRRSPPRRPRSHVWPDARSRGERWKAIASSGGAPAGRPPAQAFVWGKTMVSSAAAD